MKDPDRNATTARAFQLSCVFGLGLLALAWLGSSARASTLAGDYFKIPFGHPDTGKGIDFTTVTGLVKSTLGPDGLPVVSAFGATYAGPSGPITDVNGSGEILWWTAGQDGVLFEKSQIDTLPLAFPAFYPDGQTGDTPFYRSVHWTGTFSLPTSGTITIGLGSDDDAWVFIDGTLQVDNGGVHGVTFVPTVTSPLTAGGHTIDVFFADRHTTGSGIFLDASVSFQAPTAVPEPSSTCLLLSAVVSLGTFLIRPRRRAANA
ncbi:MAG TPA: PA14 domain-containing protein [Gemmataceae bacterium]|jgi:fibro-slime domain-containing protein|nr:PA14 domain-containing protein [Gemmataceae bacterium]